MRRLRARLNKSVPLTVRRTDVKTARFAYVVVASKPYEYPFGRSPIVWIGTTRRGLTRIAESVASVAEEVLNLHGVLAFDVRVVTCPPRRRVRTWRKLERALLLRFREKFGEVPLFNQQGKKMRERDEFKYFRREGLDRIFARLQTKPPATARRQRRRSR